MNFSISWLDSGGKQHFSHWCSSNYPIGKSHTSPDLDTIGVPSDAVAVTPYVHAILGNHTVGSPMVKAASKGQEVATYEVKGTTLDFSVTLVE